MKNICLKFLLLAICIASAGTGLNAQFKSTNKGATLSSNGGGGSIDSCVGSEDITIELLLQLGSTTTNGSGDTILDFGCDIYVGITNDFNGITQYVPMPSINDMEAGSHETYYYMESNGFGDTGKGSYHKATVLGLNWEIDVNVPTSGNDDFECIEDSLRGDYYVVNFTANLFCKNGDKYDAIDPCEYEEFFFFEELNNKDCSIEVDFSVEVCCKADSEDDNDVSGFGLQSNDRENSIQAGFSNDYNNLVIVNRGVANQTVEYLISDITGAVVRQNSIELGITFTTSNIDLSELRDGLYFVSMIDENNKVTTIKFVKM